MDDTLCVWKVRDGKSVAQGFPELITALQFKPVQTDGESVLDKSLLPYYTYMYMYLICTYKGAGNSGC